MKNVTNMNPGSKKAIKAGCICPVIGNKHGRGAYISEIGEPVFWFNYDCPIHGKAQDISSDTLLYDLKK